MYKPEKLFLCIISKRYCVVGALHCRDCYEDCPCYKCYGVDTTGDVMAIFTESFTKCEDFVKYNGKVLTNVS